MTADVLDQRGIGVHLTVDFQVGRSITDHRQGLPHFFGALLAAGMDPGQLYIRMNAATGNPEMNALCQGLFHEAEWFVTGEGEIMGNKYEHVLKPRSTVTIKGIAEAYSGVYYVNHVTHSFTPDGYTQTFRIKRNGINPTGAEDFSGNGGLLSGLL